MQSIKVRKVFFIFMSLSIFKLFGIALDDTPRSHATAVCARAPRPRLIERKNFRRAGNVHDGQKAVGVCFARLLGFTEAGSRTVLVFTCKIAVDSCLTVTF
jgi:hypothetical protein